MKKKDDKDKKDDKKTKKDHPNTTKDPKGHGTTKGHRFCEPKDEKCQEMLSQCGATCTQKCKSEP